MKQKCKAQNEKCKKPDFVEESGFFISICRNCAFVLWLISCRRVTRAKSV